MTHAEAVNVVAYLNAGFPRDALEPESFAIWVGEVVELPSAAAGIDAAKVCVRGGERFPTVREFRTAYRQAFDRHMASRPALPEAPVGSIPDDVQVWLRERGLTAAGVVNGEIVLGGDIPPTTRVAARPVWDRYERRTEMVELLPPSALEMHDAIVVLRDHNPDDDTYVGQALHVEATRILDEAS